MILYKSEQLEVEYFEEYGDFYLTVYDEGLESEYVHLNKEQMARLVSSVQEKL